MIFTKVIRGNVSYNCLYKIKSNTMKQYVNIAKMNQSKNISNKKYIDHVSDNLSKQLKDFYKYKYNKRRKT